MVRNAYDRDHGNYRSFHGYHHRSLAGGAVASQQNSFGGPNGNNNNANYEVPPRFRKQQLAAKSGGGAFPPPPPQQISDLVKEEIAISSRRNSSSDRSATSSPATSGAGGGFRRKTARDPLQFEDFLPPEHRRSANSTPESGTFSATPSSTSASTTAEAEGAASDSVAGAGFEKFERPPRFLKSEPELKGAAEGDSSGSADPCETGEAKTGAGPPESCSTPARSPQSSGKKTTSKIHVRARNHGRNGHFSPFHHPGSGHAGAAALPFFLPAASYFAGPPAVQFLPNQVPHPHAPIPMILGPGGQMIPAAGLAEYYHPHQFPGGADPGQFLLAPNGMPIGPAAAYLGDPTGFGGATGGGPPGLTAYSPLPHQMIPMHQAMANMGLAGLGMPHHHLQESTELQQTLTPERGEPLRATENGSGKAPPQRYIYVPPPREEDDENATPGGGYGFETEPTAKISEEFRFMKTRKRGSDGQISTGTGNNATTGDGQDAEEMDFCWEKFCESILAGVTVGDSEGSADHDPSEMPGGVAGSSERCSYLDDSSFLALAPCSGSGDESGLSSSTSSSTSGDTGGSNTPELADSPGPDPAPGPVSNPGPDVNVSAEEMGSLGLAVAPAQEGGLGGSGSEVTKKVVPSTPVAQLPMAVPVFAKSPPASDLPLPPINWLSY